MDRVAITILTTLAIIVFATTMTVTCARAQDTTPLPKCQTTSPCKVIMLSREEEEALTGPNQILDTALQGRPLDLLGKVTYFRDKLRTAPAGAPLTSPAPPTDPQPPK